MLPMLLALVTGQEVLVWLAVVALILAIVYLLRRI